MVFTQADRDGKALDFAQRYQASALCTANAAELQHDLERREVSPQIAKELRARQGTSTPFYFGVKTILKVELPPRPACCLNIPCELYEAPCSGRLGVCNVSVILSLERNHPANAQEENGNSGSLSGMLKVRHC